MTDVLVAVPARDEQRQVGECLASVATALRQARAAGVRSGWPSRWPCTAASDSTAAAVEESLAAMPDLEAYHHVDEASATVGEVRHHLVSAACAALGS